MGTDAAGVSCRVMQVSRVRMNPYVSLLQQALNAAGVACSTVDGLSPGLVQSWRRTTDIVHVHWLELLYAAPRRSSSLRRLCAVISGLVWLKALGFKLVYTVHNLEPHERAPAGSGLPLGSGVFRLTNRILVALSDAVHVHDQEAKGTLEALYGPRSRVHVIPHGSYVGAYPNNCTRPEARTRLGLKPDAFVLLFVGQIRRYKGVEELVAAFRRIPDEDCVLMIAGNVHDAAYAKELAALTRGDPRIVRWFEYVRDADLQYFMNACDVCVFPYHEVTTSGAAVLAFSFGRPVIAPRLGGFPALLEGGRGITYAPNDADGLLRALQDARAWDIVAAEARAWQWAQEHQWAALAPQFVRMYKDVLGAREGNLRA